MSKGSPVASKVVVSRIERIGFFSALEYVDEVNVDGSAKDIMRVFLNEIIKAYVHWVSCAPTVRHLDERRSRIVWRNLTCTIGNVTVKIA